MMLPTRYNADIGLYVFNSNRWLLEGQLKVVHYTLGNFKPWSWWCGWLIEEQARWNVRARSVPSAVRRQDDWQLNIILPIDPFTLLMLICLHDLLQRYRMKLGPDEHGRIYGVTAMQAFAQSWMPLIPPIVLALLVRGLMYGWPAYVAPIMRWLPGVYPRSPHAAMTVTSGFACLGASAWLAGLVIPDFVRLCPMLPCLVCRIVAHGPGRCRLRGCMTDSAA